MWPTLWPIGYRPWNVCSGGGYPSTNGLYTRVGRAGQNGLAYADSGGLRDGRLDEALFTKPTAVAAGPGGVVYVADTGNHAIRQMDAQSVFTLAGGAGAGYADGREGAARFDTPQGIAVGPDGALYVADTLNHCIRRIAPDGTVSLFAGTPGQPGYRDGGAAQARFYEPCGLYYAPDGVLYVADSANHAIRRVSGSSVSTVAGRPGETDPDTDYPAGGYTDGANAEARFHFPRGVAGLPDGTLAVADTLNHAVRLVGPDETRTLAGGGRAGKYYGAAENLAFTRPEAVLADGETLYVADTLNNRVVAVKLTARALAGRPSRLAMLAATGLTTDSAYAYRGEVRVYIGDTLVDMGRVKPWNTAEGLYVPLRPFFEALGAEMTLDERTRLVTIRAGGKDTLLTLDRDYFILKGAAVTTFKELTRLFPYTLEWFEEYSLITAYVPPDMRADG